MCIFENRTSIGLSIGRSKTLLEAKENQRAMLARILLPKEDSSRSFSWHFVKAKLC